MIKVSDAGIHNSCSAEAVPVLGAGLMAGLMALYMS